MLAKDYEYKMVRLHKLGGTEEKDQPTVGGGGGEYKQMGMVLTSTAYATVSASQTTITHKKRRIEKNDNP